MKTTWRPHPRIIVFDHLDAFVLRATGDFKRTPGLTARQFRQYRRLDTRLRRMALNRRKRANHADWPLR